MAQAPNRGRRLRRKLNVAWLFPRELYAVGRVRKIRFRQATGFITDDHRAIPLSGSSAREQDGTLLAAFEVVAGSVRGCGWRFGA